MTFDHTSTADDVLADIDLSNKEVLITGASGGLGEETARALASRGAKVTIVARSEEKLKAAQHRIQEKTGHKVAIGQLDLMRPASVVSFAQAYCQAHPKLDILINNAGIMGCPLTRTTEGWEMQFTVNHLGHFALSGALLPALRGSGNARVVSLASSGHNVASVDFEDVHFNARPYTPMVAYGQSKTANVWFALEFDRRFKGSGIRAFSVHPGGIQTDLGRHITDEVMQEIREIISARAQSSDGKTIEQGAATSCFAATAPGLETEGGKYFVNCAVAPLGDDIFKCRAPWADSVDDAKRLWDLSNELLGTRYE